jgi:hypothetical protein
MVFEKIYFNWPVTKKNLTDILVVRSARNMEMLYRTSYTSFIQGINLLCLLVVPTMFFLSNRDEIKKKSYREPSIDVSCKIPVHLAKWFRRRRLKCEKLTDDGRQVMTRSHWLRPVELKRHFIQIIYISR